MELLNTLTKARGDRLYKPLLGTSSTPSITPSGGTLICPFDEYQNIIASLDNVASVTVQLNVPAGSGDFVLVFIQGGSTPSSVTFTTEGSHAVYGAIDVPTGAGERSLARLFYDGSTWYVSSTAMPLLVSS